LDVERFRSFFIEKGFVQKDRVIPTPQGPLKEYLLYDPSNMRDLIVCSVKGFVVDAKNIENAQKLMSLAYEIFEQIYGDLFLKLVFDIQLIVKTLIYVKDGYLILTKTIDSNALKKMTKLVGSKNVSPNVIGFSWGKRNSPTGHTSINIAPLKSIEAEPLMDRLSVTIEHLDTDPDRGVEFVNKLEKFLKEIIRGLLV
jgi:hypothetical protein